MIELSIIYDPTNRAIPAVLKRASRPGYWNVWAVNDDDAPIACYSTYGRPIRGPLEGRIPNYRAAERWPEHAEAIQEVRDSSD